LDKAPDAFRTISEVADDLDIPQHVLRFWETRFSQIKPMKRSGGRRYYRPDDVDLLSGIRRLLYGEGYTIRGVQRILKEQGVKAVQLAAGASAPSFGANDAGMRHDAVAERDVDVSAKAVDRDNGERGVASVETPSAPEIPPRLPGVTSQIGPQAPGITSPAVESARLVASGSKSRALDTAKLQAALQDLIACRQLLDGAMKEG